MSLEITSAVTYLEKMTMPDSRHNGTLETLKDIVVFLVLKKFKILMIRSCFPAIEMRNSLFFRKPTIKNKHKHEPEV